MPEAGCHDRRVRPAVGLHVSWMSIQETIPQSQAGAVSLHAHLPGGREGAVGTAGPVGLAWSRTLQGSGHWERLPGKLGAVPLQELSLRLLAV
jgi:hypothetical protein